MLHCLQIPETNIIELTVDGQITEEEFDDILDILEDTIREHESIRVLNIIRSLGEFPTIPFSRVWDDVRFGLQHFSEVSRAAVVSDLPWLETMVKVVQPLLKAEVRWFPESQLETARAWLREA